MNYLKKHYKFDDFETVCGKELKDKEHIIKVCRENIDDVTCGSCKKIMLVFKTDHYNRPKKERSFYE